MAGETVVKEAVDELSALSSKRRFAVMDGLRGVAALSVVLFHSYKGGGLVPNGALAVDLFFILSGFVIAYSYDARVRQPGGARKFAISRFIRLYPMLFIGALGGIALALVHNVLDPANAYDYAAIATSGGLSLLALPYLSQKHFGGEAFSFNPPLWSLFFEIVANLLYVALARFLNLKVLIALVIVGLFGVVWLGALGGGGKADFASGFPRVICGFFGGVLLFRLHSRGQLPKIGSNIFVLSAAMLALFAIPTLIGGLLYLPTFAALMLIVASAAHSRPASPDGWCEVLGLISYPVYLIHWLTIYVATFLGNRLGLVGPLYVVVVIVHLAAIPAVGFLVAKYYETPTRLLLSRTLQARRGSRSDKGSRN